MEVSSDAEGSSDFTRDFSIEDIDMSLTRCGLLPEQAEELLPDRSAALRTQIRMLYCPICGGLELATCNNSPQRFSQLFSPTIVIIR
jgi:hypothetical protein